MSQLLSYLGIGLLYICLFASIMQIKIVKKVNSKNLNIIRYENGLVEKKYIIK